MKKPEQRLALVSWWSRWDRTRTLRSSVLMIVEVRYRPVSCLTLIRGANIGSGSDPGQRLTVELCVGYVA